MVQQSSRTLSQYISCSLSGVTRFLGPRMIYTSGVILDPHTEETLEQLQDNKLAIVCSKLDLKPTDRYVYTFPLCPRTQLTSALPLQRTGYRLRLGNTRHLRCQELRLRRNGCDSWQEPGRVRDGEDR